MQKAAKLITGSMDTVIGKELAEGCAQDDVLAATNPDGNVTNEGNDRVFHAARREPGSPPDDVEFCDYLDHLGRLAGSPQYTPAENGLRRPEIPEKVYHLHRYGAPLAHEGRMNGGSNPITDCGLTNVRRDVGVWMPKACRLCIPRKPA
jgi:hypothetical protein